MGQPAVDLLFDLVGGRVPADHAYALWRAIADALPWLETDAGIGVHPLRTSPAGDGTVLLARRTKLVLRLPDSRVADALTLSGHSLDVGGLPLSIGAGRPKALHPSRTLHADVASATPDTGEAEFLDRVEDLLASLGVTARALCGKRRTLTTEGRTISGYSLVLHDLKADESLRIQHEGLGEHRRLGFGIFVPYKTISLTED